MTATLRSSVLLMLGSLVVALVLTFLPLPAWAAIARPALFPATVLFWVLHQPHRVGVLVAWFAGLLLDAGYTTPLGQHALALALAAFIVFKMRDLLWTLPLIQQGVALLPALIAYAFTLFWIDGINGRQVDLWWRWLPVLSTAVVWPLWSLILERFALVEVDS